MGKHVEVAFPVCMKRRIGDQATELLDASARGWAKRKIDVSPSMEAYCAYGMVHGRLAAAAECGPQDDELTTAVDLLQRTSDSCLQIFDVPNEGIVSVWKEPTDYNTSCSEINEVLDGGGVVTNPLNTLSKDANDLSDEDWLPWSKDVASFSSRPNFPCNFRFSGLDRFRGGVRAIVDAVSDLCSCSLAIGALLSSFWAIMYSRTCFIILRSWYRYIIEVVTRKRWSSPEFRPPCPVLMDINGHNKHYSNEESFLADHYYRSSSSPTVHLTPIQSFECAIFAERYKLQPFRTPFRWTPMQSLERSISADHCYLPSHTAHSLTETAECDISINQYDLETSSSFNLIRMEPENQIMLFNASSAVSFDVDHIKKKVRGYLSQPKAFTDVYFREPLRNLFILCEQAELEVAEGLVMCTRHSLRKPRDWSCRSSSSDSSS